MTCDPKRAVVAAALVGAGALLSAYGACRSGEREAGEVQGSAAGESGAAADVARDQAGIEEGGDAGAGGATGDDAETSVDSSDAAEGLVDTADGSGPEDAPGDAKSDGDNPLAGWEPIPWMPVECHNTYFQAAIPVEKLVPKLTWIPCTDQMPGCHQTPVPPFPGAAEITAHAEARKRAGRVEAVLMFYRYTSGDGTQPTNQYFVIYQDQTPKAAWRYRPLYVGGHDCPSPIVALSSVERVVLELYGTGTGSTMMWLASGSIDDIAANARSLPGASVPNALLGGWTFERRRTSDTLFVGHAVTAVVFAALPSGPSTALQPGPGIAWDTPRVVGNTVFVTHRATPYEIWVRLPDGTTKPLVKDPKRWSYALETDGTWMAWLEGVGPPPDAATDLFDHTELWKAPFSTDPAAIASTRQKIAEFPWTKTGADTIGGDGLYAIRVGYAGLLAFDLETNVRHDLAGSSADSFVWLSYLGRDEFWAVVGDRSKGNENYAAKRYAGSMFNPPF
jgi:hypothetical protein